MSWLNFSGVTCRGPSWAEWQSRQELTACANAGHEASRSDAASAAERAASSELLRKEAIDSHTYYAHQGKNGNSGDPSFATGGFLVLKEGQQQPQQSGQAATKDAEHLAVDDPDLGGNHLEGLEHEKEVPLGLDAGRGGDEGVGLDAEVPGEDGGQRAEHAHGHVPGHQFAQRAVGKELH